MKLLCWNINSLVPTVRNAVLKHGSWLGFFQDHGLDILCLQETKLPEDRLTRELCCVGTYQSFWAAPREKRGYSGVATYAAEAWAPLASQADCLGSGEGEEQELDQEGRVVLTDHGAFVLLNVYVPNAGDRPARPRLAYKLRFLAALKRKCDELAAQGRELLIVGDFNVPAEAADVHPDLLPGGSLDELYSWEEQAALHALTVPYPDVWRRLHPEERGTYSVWNERTSARAFNRGLRIDYVLCTPGLLGRVASCKVLGAELLPPKWSDHAGLLLELRGVEPPPPHPPCPQWQRLHRRFVDVTQRSLLGIFGKKRAADAAATQPAAGEAAVAAPAPGKEGGPAAADAGAGPDYGGAKPCGQQGKRRRGADGSSAAQGSASQPEVCGPDQAVEGEPKHGSGAAHGRGAGSGARSGRGRPSAKAPEGGKGQRTIAAFFAAAARGGGGGGRGGS